SGGGWLPDRPGDWPWHPRRVGRQQGVAVIMATVDILRPTEDVTLTGYTLQGGQTTAWETLSDDTDATYLDPPATQPPVPYCSVGVGSSSAPASHRRHQLRANVRGFSDFGPGHSCD